MGGLPPRYHLFLRCTGQSWDLVWPWLSLLESFLGQRNPSNAHSGRADQEKSSELDISQLCALFLPDRNISTVDCTFWGPSHGFGLLEIWLISNLGKELVDRFFENHIDPLPCLVLVIT